MSNGTRIVTVVLVFACTGYAYLTDVSMSEFGSIRQGGPLGWAYLTISLFVLNGLEVGLPVYSTHHPVGYVSLWTAFFLAPLITTSFAAEALINLMRARRERKPQLSNHLIVVGSGDFTHAYVRAVQTSHPDKQILLVEHDKKYPPGTASELLQRDAHLIYLQGNFLDPEALRHLHLETAGEAVLIDPDDQTNLELGWRICAHQPHVNTAAHVADLGLLRRVTPIVRNARLNAQTRAPALFSTHYIASLQLYDLFLAPHFETTQGKDFLVILGFGRFAQTVLELVAASSVAELDQCVLVAPDAAFALRKFSADVPLTGVNIDCIDGDLEDPHTWQALSERLEDFPGIATMIMATDNTLVNFRVATLARQIRTDARIFVRCFQSTEFSATFATEMQVDLICFEEIIGEALQDHFEALSAL